MPPILIATLYAETGDAERSLSWLERAAAERDPQIYALNQPIWDDVRHIQGFAELKRRIGLP